MPHAFSPHLISSTLAPPKGGGVTLVRQEHQGPVRGCCMRISASVALSVTRLVCIATALDQD